MDPTAVPPPSAEKSPPPPPQNPRSLIDAIIDASAFHCYQKGEPSTSRSMDNFRALVLKLAGRLLPAHQLLIERRLDDIFPDELLVPDHPPYADMILTALWELNAEGGSSEEAISDFIVKEYPELPWAHATMLHHHLGDLCMKGKISMTHDGCYLRRSSITKPVPSLSPCHHLRLEDSPCSSPVSSSYSSSSASLCSTPTSSSSSLFSDPPYQRQKRQLKRKRKRKNIKERGGKKVQVRGRGRGRGRPPRIIQAGQRGGSLGMIQARRRGRPSKKVKDGKRSRKEEQVGVIDADDLVVDNRNKLEEPKQVTEDQNEGTGMEVEEDGIQDRDLCDVIVSIDQKGREDCAEKQQNHPQKKNNAVVETMFSVEDQTKVIVKGESVGVRCSGRRKNDVSEEENVPCEQRKVGAKEQYRPQKQYNVTWIGHGEHIQQKGECVKQKRLGSKPRVSKEQHRPCEQLEKGVKEQGHERKPRNVVWIGRGVRKLKQARRDLLKEHSDDVTEVEDDVSEKEDVEVDEHVERLKQKEEKGGTNVERPEENQMYGIAEVDYKVLTSERQERVGMEPKLEVAEKLQLGQHQYNEVLPETLQEVGVIKAWSGKQKLVEGESMEQNGSQLQQNDVSGEQVDLQKQSKEENDNKLHTQRQQSGNMEPDQPQKQEVHMADEHDSVMMQCEAQVTVASVEKQHDDTVEEQIRSEEQPNKGTKEDFQSHEQKSGGAEQEMLEIQVEMVGKPLQDEELQKGIHEEKDVVTIPYEAKTRVETAEKTEPEEQHDNLTEKQVETKEQSKELHDDVTEQPVHPQEQCVEKTKEKLQTCGEDHLKNGEAESAKEQPQQAEQQIEVNQKQIGLVMNTEVQQDLQMNQSETEVKSACVIQNELEVEGDNEEHDQSEVHQDQLAKLETQDQKDENEAGFEKNQSVGSKIEGLRAFSCNSSSVEKVCLPDHKHQDEQRRQLRQGLRSSCKKEEATPNAKNQPERVTPVRRSLRPRKTISEAAIITEGPDRLKEQVKHSGCARRSKRKPKFGEAEQVSKSQKTRRNHL